MRFIFYCKNKCKPNLISFIILITWEYLCFYLSERSQEECHIIFSLNYSVETLFGNIKIKKLYSAQVPHPTGSRCHVPVPPLEGAKAHDTFYTVST